MEIRTIFTGQIMKLFKEDVKKDGAALNAFCDVLKNGDAEGVEQQFEKYLKKTISIRDTFVRKPTKENLPTGKAITKASEKQKPSACFYHGILLGILGFKESWGVSSNKEAGDGYNDIQVEIDDEDVGIVIEVKYAHDADLESGCTEALEQIKKNGYAEQLREDGMQTILMYGIACYKKKCRVLLEKEEQ